MVFIDTCELKTFPHPQQICKNSFKKHNTDYIIVFHVQTLDPP